MSSVLNILHIDSSISGEKSVSRALTEAVAARLKTLHPGAEYAYRDLAQEPPNHYTATVRHRRGPSELSNSQRAELSLAQELIDEFRKADVVIVGAPMYNLGVPSQLKAWIDHLVVPGVTFGFGPNGPMRLLGNKRIIVVSTRGMSFAPGTSWERFDYQEAFLRDMFQFLGISDFTVVRAEGVGSPDRREAVLRQAYAQIGQLG
jgi:FMN-dependent NADH-azoreductase